MNKICKFYQIQRDLKDMKDRGYLVDSKGSLDSKHIANLGRDFPGFKLLPRFEKTFSEYRLVIVPMVERQTFSVTQFFVSVGIIRSGICGRYIGYFFTRNNVPDDGTILIVSCIRDGRNGKGTSCSFVRLPKELREEIIKIVTIKEHSPLIYHEEV
jgi:hypothetical protein